MKKSILTATLLLTALFTAHAGEKTTEDFSGGAMPESWKAAKGAWEVVDGALSGKELEADNHGAVLTIPDVHKDSTFSCRFQVNGAKMMGLSFNHPKGHLFRVTVNAKSANLSLDKDKKDPTSKSMSFAKADLDLMPGEWYSLSCTVNGDTVEVEVADAKLSGTHEKLTMEKTGYRFVCAGESIMIDDVSFSSSE